MPPNPFAFLLEVSERQGRVWLSRYLLDEPTDPGVPMPFDLGRLEFLLGEVARIPQGTLSVRVGELSGGLLAETIVATPLPAADSRLLRALFGLVEALPASETTVEFLIKLAVSGLLLPWPDGERPDYHLLTLRALVLRQRPLRSSVARLVEFWTREAQDLRYASVAVQGLLRVSPVHGIDVLIDFVERALHNTPPISFANLLFALTVALDDHDTLWARLASVAFRNPRVFSAIRDGLRKLRLPDSNARAWDVLEGSCAAVSWPGAGDHWGLVLSPTRIVEQRQHPRGSSAHPRREQRDSMDGPSPHDEAEGAAPPERTLEVVTLAESNRRYHNAA